MSSAGESDAIKRQSVFISYASEDRAAVRALRDALGSAGLEVWFDENELGGGDAWDQKIRKQIRDCDYFMPVISAATERRKEGYFRREWRLAVERTMDMADDVLFLVPVTIDETSENHARVPDKFLAVQWLRLPGALPTEALQILARRMLAGDHRPPPLLSRNHTPSPGFPGSTGSRAAQALPPVSSQESHQPLPMPPFPHGPASNSGMAGGLKFAAEVVWWAVNCVRFILRRLPKFVRVILVVWLVVMFISRCSRSDSPSDRSVDGQVANARRAEKRALSQLPDDLRKGRNGDKIKTPSAEELTKLGQRVVRTLTTGLTDASDKQLVLVPFPQTTVTDEADQKSLQTIFASLYGKLKLANTDEVGVLQEPMQDLSKLSPLEQGKVLDCDFMLHATESEPHVLTLELLSVKQNRIAWTGSYPLTNVDAPATADQIATAVLALLPKK